MQPLTSVEREDMFDRHLIQFFMQPLTSTENYHMFDYRLIQFFMQPLTNVDKWLLVWLIPKSALYATCNKYW